MERLWIMESLKGKALWKKKKRICFWFRGLKKIKLVAGFGDSGCSII